MNLNQGVNKIKILLTTEGEETDHKAILPVPVACSVFCGGFLLYEPYH